TPSKRFFQATTLEELIKTCPIRRRMTEAEQHREFQSRVALIDFLRGLLQLDPDRRWSPRQAAAHPFITGEPFLGHFIPPSDAGTSSGSRGPYDAAPGSGHYHSGGGGSSNASGGGNGTYPHTIGYSSRYAGPAGGGGYTAHAAYGSASSGSGAPSVFGQPALQHGAGGPATYGGAADAATWAYRSSGAASGSDGVLSIPGAFPASGAQSRRSSQHAEQPPGLLPPPPAHMGGSKSRERAATLSLQIGAALAPGVHAEQAAAGGAHSYAYPQHRQLGGFLGVDPSTSHTSDSLAAGGEPRDVPGRLDASLSGSEYSVGTGSLGGWASWSETNYSGNYSGNDRLSNAGSHETHTGGGRGSKAAEPQALRSYLLGERQRQRLAQQRLPHVGEQGGGRGRLVSNMSPLTLPSTPGSSVYSSRYAGSAARECLLEGVPGA
ncbi:dual specificity protein kinase yak1, partial [Coemansia nantahalensis]